MLALSFEKACLQSLQKLRNFGLAQATSSRTAWCLHRRALDRAVRAEYATVAGQRFEHRAADLALVEPLARVRRHAFALDVTAVRARQRRVHDDLRSTGFRHLARCGLVDIRHGHFGVRATDG